MAAVPKQASRWWAITLGVGVSLSPVHNQYLTHLLTNSKGETLFFLPAFGYLLLIMGAGLFLLNNWRYVKAIGWGDRRIVGCLLFIVLAISASGAAYTGLQDRFAPTGMGLALFALYLCGRVLGKDMFLPLAIGAAVASLGVIAHQVVYPGVITGGFVFENNYDIVVGYVLLGTALWIHKWQWLLAGLALVAMLLTGSPEAVFALSAIGVVVLIRKDWGRRLLLTTEAVALVAVAFFGSGYGGQTYSYLVKIVTSEIATDTVIQEDPAAGGRLAIGYRVRVILDSLGDIQPLGTGYSVTDFRNKVLPSGKISMIVHNVPLVIVQQLGYPGVLAAIAWLWVSIWCLVKTRWKYAWVALIALSFWDHFVWSQLGVVYWILIGVSTAPDNIKSDLLFRQ